MAITPDNTLLYLVYGQDPKYQTEATYSILSALREARNGSAAFRIVLLSDEYNIRPDLPVESWVATPEEFSEWTLGGTYSHAIKTHALIRALQRYGGKVCLVDTDTCFISNPTHIFDRIDDASSVMHAPEDTLATQPLWSSLLEYAAHSDLSGIVHPSAQMLNSGVVGTTAAMISPLQEAIRLMARLHGVSPVFNIEQFSTGAMLRTHSQVQFAEDVVDHYWGYRRHIYHAKIPPAIEALAGRYTPATAIQLTEIAAPKSPIAARLLARFNSALHHADGTYRFAYQAYLSSIFSQDASDRRIWANIAVDSLELSTATTLAKTQFKRFHPENLQTSGLDPETSARWMSFWAGIRP